MNDEGGRGEDLVSFLVVKSTTRQTAATATPTGRGSSPADRTVRSLDKPSDRRIDGTTKLAFTKRVFRRQLDASAPLSEKTKGGNVTEKKQTRVRTVYADPPWPTYQHGKLGAASKYPLMSMDAIRQMPVGDLVEDDAHLWLWTTNAALEEAYAVARAWGFEPRSIFTWVKPRLGLGNYLRNATEQLLFATKGRAPILFKGQPNWSFLPLQDHSHKPEELFAIIERCSPGPYAELFARRRPPSDKRWLVWGDSIASDIEVPGYPVPSYSFERTPR